MVCFASYNRVLKGAKQEYRSRHNCNVKLGQMEDKRGGLGVGVAPRSCGTLLWIWFARRGSKKTLHRICSHTLQFKQLHRQPRCARNYEPRPGHTLLSLWNFHPLPPPPAMKSLQPISQEKSLTSGSALGHYLLNVHKNAIVITRKNTVLLVCSLLELLRTPF